MEIDILCNICPRKCHVDRTTSKGFCGMGSLPVIAGAFLHKWEEPCISGTEGSGTVFFSGCNLKCVYCQNSDISQGLKGREITTDRLAEIYFILKDRKAHNINLVNPTHYTVQIRESLEKAGRLDIPVIYNTNGYESIEGLKAMDGFADVYLPDLKYFRNETAFKLSHANDYFETATAAILEMYRQVGSPVFNAEGLIRKGLVIRHLILPGLSGESLKVLDWIGSNLPHDVYISLMSQYVPYHKAHLNPEINRRITRWEYERVVNHMARLGLENGYVQERDSAEECYIPEFNLTDTDW